MDRKNDCLFCSIIEGKIPGDRVYETEMIIVINDRYPKAPIHKLIIPKKHIRTLLDVKEADIGLSEEVTRVVQHLALQVPEPRSFNIICNNGREAGQSIFHLHWHFLSGKNIYHETFSL